MVLFVFEAQISNLSTSCSEKGKHSVEASEHVLRTHYKNCNFETTKSVLNIVSTWVVEKGIQKDINSDTKEDCGKYGPHGV